MTDLFTARSRFQREIDANPRLKTDLYGLTRAEVGSQGPQAQQAFMESVLNRAAARNKSLSDTIWDRNYFPAITHQRMSAGGPTTGYDPIYDAVMKGSNVSGYATGNASGTVGFAGGPQTFAAGGERYGIEGPDRKWAEARRSFSLPQDPEMPGLAPPPQQPAGPSPQSSPMTTGATPMASPYTGPSPDDVSQYRKIAAALQGQATDASPVGHWTQALARVLQGGVGGMYANQAREGEQQGRAAGQQAVMQALQGGGDQTAAIGSLMGSPWTRETGEKLAQSAIASKFQPKYGFTPAGDNLYRTNSATGAAEVVGGASKGTTDEKNYKAYVEQEAAAGRPVKSFMEYQQALKQAGATAITTDMRGENAEARALGEGAGKRANDTMDRARGASTRLQQLNTVAAQLDSVANGKLEPGKASVGQWAKAFGLSDDALKTLGIDPKLPGSAQAIAALTNRMVVDMIGSGGFPANNFSDADRNFLESTVPRLANEPRANKIIIEVARRMAQLDVEKGKALYQWRRAAENKSKSVDEFELAWADSVAQRDVMGDLRREADQLTGMTPPPAPGTNGGWKMQRLP